MSYIKNKLDELIDTYRKETGFTEYDVRMVAERLVKDYHNYIVEKLLKHFNNLEMNDTDDSMKNWRNYKFIRNNIVDCLQDNPASQEKE